VNTWHFVKGHGTGNDFLILTDGPDPTAAEVAALCDRHRGLGADGILRAEPTAEGWFMDYRNSDGSLAEMCGNGIRVFARWLVLEQMAPPGTFPVVTRGGLRSVEVEAAGDIRVDMGPATLGEAQLVWGQPATAVDLGNPHLVLSLSASEVAGADLTKAPDGLDQVNVELVALTGPRELTMRVHERGSGETLSCGTGACAAAVAAATWSSVGATGEPWTVTVPGGVLTVEWTPETVFLSGPAVLLADGSVSV
jgi:diaminopimelate epimerase